MAMLFFLPWLRLRDDLQIGGIEFRPFVRGESNIFGPNVSAEQVEAVLANYGDRSHTPGGHSEPVSHAVVLHWQGTVFGADLPDEEARSRMELGHLVAAAGLSNRQYGSHFRYTNRDELRLIGQRFSLERPGAISVLSRRRDGTTNHMMGESKGQPRFIRPPHVSSQGFFNPDIGLLEALLLSRQHTIWPTIRQAISVFNLANTDAEGMTDDVELVLHRVAFESLLKASHQTHDLKQKVVAAIDF